MIIADCAHVHKEMSPIEHLIPAHFPYRRAHGLGYSRSVLAVYRFFRSPRLAVVLILVITAVSLVATLVPQGRPDPWYQARYGAILYALIRALSLETFFSSAVFLVPVAAFTVNLGVCAADRLIVRAQNKAKPRFGPDLVHIGLLILIAGGLVSALGRQETTWTLSAGESAAITPAYSLSFLSFQFLRYPDGSPREWISTVKVMRDGKEAISSFPIEVNHPLRLRGLSVYQASWDVAGTLGLAGQDGATVTPPPVPGDYFEQGDTRWVFARFEKDGDAWTAVFEHYRETALLESRALHAGDIIGPFTVRGVEAKEVTGLKAVRDPGGAPFLAALVLIVAGLALTFIQKRGDSPA
jgi:hypothetical protein